MKKKTIIYGIGDNYKTLMRDADLHDIEIVALVDVGKHGTYQDGRIIQHPKCLKDIQYDQIYITPDKFRDIVEYLVNEIGVDCAKIMCTKELNARYLANKDFSPYRYVMFTDTTDYTNYPYVELNRRPDFLMSGLLLQEEALFYDGQSCDAEITFIFQDHIYRNFKNASFMQFVRKKYPKSRLVLLLTDMCDGEYGENKEYGEDHPKNIMRIFDLVLTYHKAESLKYGFTYCPQTHPFNKVPSEPEYDVLFIGYSKNRLDLIHRAFKRLKSQGLKCRFWINKVADEDKLVDSEITYNRLLTYEECLAEVGKCRCILEICQIGDETSYRFAEAVINNKKLVVSDKSCKSKKYFSPEFMQCFDRPEDIDCEWIKRDIVVDYNYKNDFAPERFLDFIDEKLEDGSA